MSLIKGLSIKSKIFNILFWSVVSAAFIGPGTVTTAISAGASSGYSLLWALAFSTFACLLLQEASARIAIYSGMNLGQAIAKQFEGRATSALVLLLVIGAIILGSAAYETGNILGSIAGIRLIMGDIPSQFLVLAIGIIALIALNLRSVRAIARFMGFVVMLMGVSFLFTALYLKPSPSEIVGGFLPSIPDGTGWLILGLIGTTVVPYDLFLGSGVADKKQKISEMRFGLSVAIILGGIISMAILVVGTKVVVPEEGEFTYALLAETLKIHIGDWAVYIFGFGMFAAGFSSSITAPLASAITAKSLFGNGKNKEKWATQSRYFKMVWGFVLFVGLGFGIADINPVPAIILAQALNGLILPFISIFIIFVVNDSKLMGKKGINGWFSNILMGIVVWITLMIGMTKIIKALTEAWKIASQEGLLSIQMISIITLLISLWVLVQIYLGRQRQKNRKNKKQQTESE